MLNVQLCLKRLYRRYDVAGMVICQGGQDIPSWEMDYFHSTHLLDVMILSLHDLDLNQILGSETVSLRVSFGRRSFETTRKTAQPDMDWDEKVRRYLLPRSSSTHLFCSSR
jgi:hypothetical protein